MSDKIYYWSEGRKGKDGVDVDGDVEFLEFSASSPSCYPDSSPRRQPPVPTIQVSAPPDVGDEDGSAGDGVDDGGGERGGWNNKLDFLFSCISVSVGLGNVWRFPYLCYKNGGGAFLVTYGVAMLFCGVPIFFQEVAVGQYLGTGGMNMVGQLCPILQGVGYATMTIVFFLDIYYCIIIAWTLFYLAATFAALPGLPWAECDNRWNSASCFSRGMNASLKVNHSTTPVEEFWDRRVLQRSSGLEEVGGVQWELLACLLLAWALVYSIVCRGLHQSGKIIWFTALFPYAVLAVLLIRAVTLPGASLGLWYYVTPRWAELVAPGPWIDGATQIFFAYSIGTGALPALGSYNQFKHNCYQDAYITCVINTLTSLLAGCVTFSILGHIASEQEAGVEDVVQSGPGLVFLTYPDVVLKLPGAPLWAAIFFGMLLVLGIDSEFCIVESLVTGMVDMWPKTLRPHRGKFTLAVCLLMLLLGLPMVTHGGVYIFQLMDFYSASGMSLLWVCFFQTIAISWIFGARKFADCVHQMLGIRVNAFWILCWKYFAPAVMAGIFMFYCAQYEPIKYGNSYQYPGWAEIIGFTISFSSMIWIPGYAIFYLLTRPGTITENFLLGLQPDIRPRARTVKSADVSIIPLSESSAGLLPKNASFVSQ